MVHPSPKSHHLWYIPAPILSNHFDPPPQNLTWVLRIRIYKNTKNTIGDHHSFLCKNEYGQRGGKKE